MVSEQDGQEEYSGFIVVSEDTCAKSIANMRKAGGVPDFGQNLDARIADHEFNDDKSGLFDVQLDSSTGIATKADSTMFKIISRAEQLENIEPGFCQPFIEVKYAALKDSVELDSSDPRVKYNQHLTRAEVCEHPAWIAAAGGDRDKLRTYAYIWFDRTGRKTGMGFYVRHHTDQDELRMLVLHGDYADSNASGYNTLNYEGSFALKK